DRLVEDPVGTAYRRSPIAEWRPGEPDPRPEIVLIRLNQPTRRSGITWKNHAHRSGGNQRRLLAEPQSAPVVVWMYPRQRQFIAESQVQRQPRTHLPVVLNIVVAVHLETGLLQHRAGYAQRLRLAQQEVSRGIAGNDAGHAEAAHGLEKGAIQV